MSANDYLVLVHLKDAEPYVVRDPKKGYFSKKDAQRQATAHVQNLGAVQAEVVEVVLKVFPQAA